MDSMREGYPFLFQMIDKCTDNDYMVNTLQYRFKSTKSHHTYIVRVEHYQHSAYCLKFFDKANIDSKKKFSLRTKTFEHYRRNELSLYMLVNKRSVADTSDYAHKLADLVQRALMVED